MPILNATKNKLLRRRIAWLICLALVIILLAVLGQEYYYLRNSANSQQHNLPSGWPASITAIEPLSQPVLWQGKNLSDKINGKAELYLAAGFVAMHSCRFAIKEQPDKFFEVQLFAHNSPQNAFAVFSQQRRSQGAPLPWAEHGYATSNALYVQQGTYYLEITGVSADAELKQAMEAWAKAWFEQQPHTGLSPSQFFPEENRQADSIMLLAKDAFGLADFNQVWLAQYNFNGQSYLLFVKQEPDPVSAPQQLQALQDFYLLQGATRLHSLDAAGITVFELEGMYELCMPHNQYLLGVHEAPDLEQARHLLTRLQQHLAEK